MMINICEPKKIINSYSNWEFCNYNDINIWLLSHSLNYWSAIIESIRFHRSWNWIYVFWLDQYLYRFLEGLRFRYYNIKESKKDIVKIIIKLLLLNKNIVNPYIRVISYIWDNSINTINTNAIFSITITDLYVPNLDLKSIESSFYRYNDISNNYKLSSNYSRNIIEQINAQKKWYDVVIFLWKNHEILEWLSENIFIVKDNIVYTPEIWNIVDWINRRIIIWILKEIWLSIIENEINIDFLRSADEVFFSWSATWIRKIIKFWDINFYWNSKVYNQIKDFMVLNLFSYDSINNIKITKLI